MMKIFKPILLLSAVSVFLSSCIVADYPGGAVVSAAPVPFGVYDTLPDTYVGDAYFYRNRYYYGGNYQRGLYTYQGRQYNTRYYHNGRYFYGGRNQTYGNRVNRPPEYHGQSGHRLEDRSRNYNRR